MKKYGRWIIIGIVLLILATLIIRSSIQSPMLPRASEAWSRGRIMGQMSVKRPVTLLPAPNGGMLLIWSNVNGRLELAHLGVDGEILSDRIIPIMTRQARDPQLQVGSDGRLRLLWREQAGQDAGIYYALLQADGTPVGQPQAVSNPERQISEAPILIQDKKGLSHALWADDTGIQWAVLDDTGETAVEPTLLVPDGSSPMVQMDNTGRLHLIWQYQVMGRTVTIYYATLDLEQGELGTPEGITEIVVSGPMQLEAMGLGLSQNVGYVFWTEYNTKYYEYSFKYASFPLDAPQQKHVIPWQLKRGIGPLTIVPLDGQQSPLPVALSEHTMGEGEQVEIQVTLITLEAEGGDREQIVSGSTQASMKPLLIADEQSNLHMAWLETGGFGEFNVVYASTAPQVLKNYNALNAVDVIDAMFDGAFRLSTAIVSLLVALGAWAIVPVVGLVIYHLITHEETLDTRRAQVVIIVALLVVVVMSFVMPPRIGVDVTGSVLNWVLPAVSTVVTTVATVSIVRRRGEMHLFGAFFLFAIMHSVLETVLFLVF
jgi:hypothetical protein